MILGASAIASDWPSRDLTVRFWPSSFSTVPRTRTGAGAGGVWASAGTTNRPMIATAIAVLRMVDPPLSVLLQQVTQKWRGTLVFSAHISVSAEWRPGRASAKVHGNIVALSRANLVRGEIFGPTVPSEAYFSRYFPSSRPASARHHAGRSATTIEHTPLSPKPGARSGAEGGLFVVATVLQGRDPGLKPLGDRPMSAKSSGRKRWSRSAGIAATCCEDFR